MFVDWAGLTGSIVDRETGEIKPVYFFVAVLGASKLFYTEPFLSMDLFCWIQGHVHAFEYFGGSTEIIVPDNTKTGVKKPCYYEPEINPTYLEMAKYYGAAVIPARIRKPKDKSPVEKEVQDVERWIIAKLRNRTFFSLYELKQAVQELLEEANNRPFQKREGSRRTLFEAIEKSSLKPLPVESYEFAIWNRARVNVDYHLEFDKNYYSVPYQLVKQEVMVRATGKTIEIFHKHKRIASHARLSGKKYSYVTLPEHMPPHHRQFGEWTPERIVNWSKTVGPNTANLVQKIMTKKVHPEQAFRACMGIIRLSKSYTKQRVENASKRALTYGAISYQSILSILQKNLDLEVIPEQTQSQPLYHENIRGSHYYTGEAN